ncbi:unnamed protein product, partial [Mesorhabditis spiculigera]
MILHSEEKYLLPTLSVPHQLFERISYFGEKYPTAIALVIDSTTGEICGPMVEGELRLRGPTIMRGRVIIYWLTGKKPESILTVSHHSIESRPRNRSPRAMAAI